MVKCIALMPLLTLFVSIVRSATITDNIFTTFSQTCRLFMKIYGLNQSTHEIQKKLSIVWPTENDTHRLPLDEAPKYLINSIEFDERQPTVVIIHGFNDRPTSTVLMSISEIYVKNGKHNVIMLDSSKITSGPYQEYPRAAYMSRPVGEALSGLLEDLYEAKKLNPNLAHLIGMSLGAQIAGWTGKTFKKNTRRSLNRITGLDPAGPCFTGGSDSYHLCEKDADYVDVIHVNQGVQGMIENIGHADFFVNGGGPSQPGCPDSNCSHQRAAILYLNSMFDGERLFLARKCDSWESFEYGKCNGNSISEMGVDSPETTRGVFYLKTSGSTPFALGAEGAMGYKKTLGQAIKSVFWSAVKWG